MCQKHILLLLRIVFISGENYPEHFWDRIEPMTLLCKTHRDLLEITYRILPNNYRIKYQYIRILGNTAGDETNLIESSHSTPGVLLETRIQAFDEVARHIRLNIILNLMHLYLCILTNKGILQYMTIFSLD